LAGQSGSKIFLDCQERTVYEPLFKGAHQALTYAFNYSAGSLDRPAMVKMANRTPRTNRGLAGVDGGLYPARTASAVAAASANPRGRIFTANHAVPLLPQRSLECRVAAIGPHCV